MTYRVTAPLVLAVDEGGHTHHVYEGGVIEWLSDEQAEHFLSEGLAVKLGDAAPVELVDPDTVDSGDPGDKPAANAKKAELVEWLVDNALKEDGSDYTADELGSLKVAELRALVDSVE